MIELNRVTEIPPALLNNAVPNQWLAYFDMYEIDTKPAILSLVTSTAYEAKRVKTALIHANKKYHAGAYTIERRDSTVYLYKRET